MTEKETGSDDVAILCGPTDDGQGAKVLRAQRGVLSAGEVRPAKDGAPLNGAELVRLRPRQGAARVCDVEVLHAGADASPNAASLDRPAQVATRDYRRNWDRIFGPDDASAGDRDTSLN
jgi:hypothetical protein